MGEGFKLPLGNTFPTPPETNRTETTTAERPRRKSIDTPALKLDTTLVVAVSEQVNINSFPPPPKHKATKSTNVTAVNDISEKPVVQASQMVILPQDDSTEEKTPIYRSMFPRFDPAIRLSQQPYMPSAASPPPAAHYSPSMYSQPTSPPVALITDPWTASRVSSAYYRKSSLFNVEETPKLSSAEELLDLWSIALSQGSPGALNSYTLGLKCDSLRIKHESVALVSSASSEFYSIHASGSSMSIDRRHPTNSSTSIVVTTPILESATTTSPILASILPCLAESQAVDTAKRIASDNQLSMADSTKLQNEAIERVKATEAGSLLWDSDSSRYYFTMPGLTPLSDTQEAPSALPIEYTRDKSIKFLNGYREPLLTLNLVNYSLVLDVKLITPLSTSQYTLDILISALLVLAIHLHRTENQLAEPILVAPHFDPPPRSGLRGKAHVKASRKQSSTPSSSLWLSRLNPLSRPQSRVSHANSPCIINTHNNSTLTFDKDIELGSGIGSTIILPHHIPPMTRAPIRESGIAPELRGSNTGVDLSKFQAFDLEDPELGKGTKVVLRLLYWGFSVIVWILGVVVGVIAAAIVAVGGCFGNGKGQREG